jgi:hypothetical protein
VNNVKLASAHNQGSLDGVPALDDKPPACAKMSVDLRGKPITYEKTPRRKMIIFL